MSEPSSPDADDVRVAVGEVLDRPVRNVEAVDQGKNAVYEVSLERDPAVESPDGDPDERAVAKVGTATPGRVAVEPAVIERVAADTDLRVPAVLGRAPDGSGPIDAPWFLMERVEGRVLGLRSDALEFETLERLCREAGRNLGTLHAATSFDGVGPLETDDGGLAPTHPTSAWPSMVEQVVRSQLDQLEGTRFDDVRPSVRDALDDLVEALEAAAPPEPVLAHLDYRPGNLVVRPDRRPSTSAILDWGGAVATPAAYELAHTERILLDWPRFDGDRQAALRTAFYEGYGERGGDEPDWRGETAARLYRLPARLRLMKHLEEEMDGRPAAAVDRRAREHVDALEALLERT